MTTREDKRMEHLLSTFGYLAVFLLMTAESACLPVPSEVVMVFGGALASGAIPGSDANLILIIVAGTAGNLVGSYLAWLVGRYGGRASVRRWGRYVLLREHDLDRAENWFQRYGPPTVFVSRMLPVVRTFISLPAGLAGMAPIRFGLYTLAGCVPWTTALALLGYLLGSQWQKAANAFHTAGYVVGAVGGALLIIAVIRLIRRRTRFAEFAGDNKNPDVGAGS
jgi:membrane protein DedA with SNARE-associated domain